MMIIDPLVSVLMTAYNRQRYIAEAIESVLASTYKNFELIIVDDCSKDDTVSIAKKYAESDSRIKVFVNETNLGDYPNRNKAASYARGKYLKYFDSDDILYPHCLQVMVSAMENFPQAGFGLSSKVDPNKPFPLLLSPEEIYRESFFEYFHFGRAPGSSIIKTSVFLETNGFSGERMVGDLEFWLRIAKKYSMVKFPHDLYWNRLHTGQEFQSEYARITYPKRTKELIFEALSSDDCPLEKSEVKEIITEYQKRIKKKKIISFLKNLIR